MNAATARHILDTIGTMFPDAHCELNHDNAFELTIAVLLSAQCSDQMVNKVTADLFQKYKSPEDYLAVPLEELEQDIRRIGLYRNKAKHIHNLCRILIDQYGERYLRSTINWLSYPVLAARRLMSLYLLLLMYQLLR